MFSRYITLVLKIYFYLLLTMTSAAKNDLILIPMCRRMKFLKAPVLKISFHGTLLKFLQFYTISCNKQNSHTGGAENYTASNKKAKRASVIYKNSQPGVLKNTPLLV